jgi:hypothetical protein
VRDLLAGLVRDAVRQVLTEEMPAAVRFLVSLELGAEGGS